MNKKNIILLGVLVVQIVIIAFVYRPGKDVVSPGNDFFAGMSMDEVRQVRITDNEMKTISLTQAGDSWTVGKEGYPGDSQKIESILAKLVNLRSTRLVTRTKSSHNRLKIADGIFSRRVELHTADSSGHVLYFGASPNHKTIHVRLEGEDEVYLVKDISEWELQTDVDSWWQTKIVNIPDTDLTAVSLQNSSGSFSLQKDDAGTWRLEGDETELSSTAVQEFLDKAGHIRLTTYLGREAKEEYGLSEPEAELTLTTGDKTVRLQIGPLNEEENDHVVKADTLEFYVRTATYVLKPLLDWKQEDFIPAAPSPAEEGH